MCPCSPWRRSGVMGSGSCSFTPTSRPGRPPRSQARCANRTAARLHAGSASERLSRLGCTCVFVAVPRHPGFEPVPRTSHRSLAGRAMANKMDSLRRTLGIEDSPSSHWDLRHRTRSLQYPHVAFDRIPDVEDLLASERTEVVRAFYEHAVFEPLADRAYVVLDPCGEFLGREARRCQTLLLARLNTSKRFCAASRFKLNQVKRLSRAVRALFLGVEHCGCVGGT